MWISQVMQPTENSLMLDFATVSNVENNTIQAIGNNKYDGVLMALPMGISTLPQVGDTAILLSNAQGRTVCLGTSLAEGINQGELKLCAKGGASIYLKENGDIVLNGVTIHPNGTIEGGTLL